MAADLQDVPVADAEPLRRVSGETERDRAGVGLHIGPAEGLVQVDAAHPPGQAPVPLQHRLDIGGPLRLGAEAGVGVHQVPRVQKEALLAVMDPVQQPLGQSRLRKGEPGPPLILIKNATGYSRPSSRVLMSSAEASMTSSPLWSQRQVKGSSTEMSETWNTT